MWFKHLSENISPVREGAAIGLTACLKIDSFKTILESRIKDYLKQNLLKAKQQLP
jgi:hypothetical protein